MMLTDFCLQAEIKMADEVQKYLIEKKLKADEIMAKATELPDHFSQSEIQRSKEGERTDKSIDGKSVEEGGGSLPIPLKGLRDKSEAISRRGSSKMESFMDNYKRRGSSSRKQRKAISGQEKESGFILVPQEDTDESSGNELFRKRAKAVDSDIRQRIVFKNMSGEFLKVTDDGEFLKVEKEDENSKNVEDRKLSLDIDHDSQTETDHYHPTSQLEEDKKTDTASSSDRILPAVDSIDSGANAVIKKSMVCTTVIDDGIYDDTYAKTNVDHRDSNDTFLKPKEDHGTSYASSISGDEDDDLQGDIDDFMEELNPELRSSNKMHDDIETNPGQTSSNTKCGDKKSSSSEVSSYDLFDDEKASFNDETQVRMESGNNDKMKNTASSAEMSTSYAKNEILDGRHHSVSSVDRKTFTEVQGHTEEVKDEHTNIELIPVICNQIADDHNKEVDDTRPAQCAVKNLNAADMEASSNSDSLDGGSVSGKGDESDKKVDKVSLNAHDSPRIQKNQSCATCDSLHDKRPHTVNTWRMMGQVLKFCTQPGHEQQDANEKDYICLSGVHLQNRKGKWFITDGTEFHNPDELESSFEKSEEFDSESAVPSNGIAEQIRKKKRVKLGNTVICDWVPNTRGVLGKWRVYQGDSRQEETPLPSSEMSFISSPFEREITVRKPGYVAVKVETDIDRGSSEDSETAKSITNYRRDLQNDHEDTKQTLPERPNANIQDIHRDSLGDLISVSGDVISSTFKQFKGKVKQFKGLKIMPSLMPLRTSSPNPTDMFMSNELLTIRENVLVPLNRSVNLIRNHFAFAVSAQHQNQLGNDEATTSIGWLIRNQFCKAIANVLRIGMKLNAMPAQFLFGKTTGLSLWGLMKEVAMACKTEPVLLEMVKIIELSPFLFDDDIRFRCLICELLNSCNHDGSEKLLMTWFRKFLILEPVLCKFYCQGSFWRIQSQLQTGHLVEEFMLQLAQINDFPFNLHADFEFVQLRKAEEEKRNQAGIVFEREEKYDDSGLFAFE